jgi:hypothetical protein
VFDLIQLIILDWTINVISYQGHPIFMTYIGDLINECTWTYFSKNNCNTLNIFEILKKQLNKFGKSQESNFELQGSLEFVK